MPDYILHHYDSSPFAHKARLMFGLKQLAWRSVIIPLIMPKPDLMPLTGGYRRTPVLQIGADVYCDTHLIALELERRHPEPTLFPSGGEGLAAALTFWADQALFMPATTFALSHIADKLPPAFFADRAAMLSRPPTDIEKFKAAGPRLKAPLQRQLDRVADMLADGRPYVLGDRPGLADFALGHPVWMVVQSGRRSAAALEPYPILRAWLDRLAALGTGRRQEMDGKEALAIAKAAQLERYESEPDENLTLGMRVSIQSEDRVPAPVVGEIVLLRRNEIAVRREDPAVGEVAVHFPRTGFAIKPV